MNENGTKTDAKIKYSLIVPSFNEEDWLPATLKSVRAAMTAVSLPGEIIVVDNNSTDDTAKVARELGAEVVFEPINQISRARNRGAGCAKGDYLVFLDADTLITPELLNKVLAHLDGGKCCGGGALVEMDKPIPLIGRMLISFWKWASLKYKLACGAFVYCRLDAFREIGGFSEKVFAGEEIIISRQLTKWGLKHQMDFIIVEEPRIITSSRKLEWFSELKISLIVMMLVLFPFAPLFKFMCSFWYYRPPKK